jgi:hypothetical protein
MRSIPRGLILFTTLTLLSFGGIVAVQAAPADSKFDNWFPEVTSSELLNTEIVASGVFENRQGQTLGAEPVVLVAWPSQDDLAAMKDGDQVTLAVVAKVMTDSEGRFDLRVDPSQDLRRFADSNDVINFDIRAQSKGLVGLFAFSAALGPENALALTDANEFRGAPIVSKLILKTLPTDPAAARAAARTKTLSANVDDGSSTEAIVCPLIIHDIGERYATVGQVYLATDHGKIDPTYTTSANNTLGIAASVSAGPFSASGTTTIGAEQTVGFATVTAEGTYRKLNTSFMFSKFTSCTLTIAKARYFMGGDSYAATSLPSATYCVNMTHNTYRVLNESQASTWSVGFEVSGSIGIDLSSRSGYSTGSSYRFDNLSGSATKHLCGVNGVWAGTPGRIVLKD